MSERTDTLLARAGSLPTDENGESRRREDLVARLLEAGHTHEYADQVYDVALEENCDPALAVEVVLVGVGIRDLMPPSDSPEETQVEAAPAWIEPPPPPVEAERERNMRQTFRRLRSLTEKTGSSHAALEAFVREPDVGDVEY